MNNRKAPDMLNNPSMVKFNFMVRIVICVILLGLIPPMLLGSFGVLVSLVAGGYAIYYFQTNYGVSSIHGINKNDVLNDETLHEKIANLDEKTGVLASTFPNGEKLFLSEQDRALVIGPPGTGKTTFQVNQIFHWLKTGNSFVCLDIKPEIAELTREKLEENGYKIIIYNPTSPVDKYNFLDDLDTPEAVGEFASALIPSKGNDNAVFEESARDFLDALILHVKSLKKDDRASLAGVYDLMTSYDNITALLNDLAHSKSDQCKRIVKTLKIIADNERLLGSIFANFVASLRFLRYDNIRESLGRDGFSLDVLNSQKVALFLQFEEATNKTTGHLFSVMVGHVMNHLINNTDREPVLCLFDEIGNAGRINELTIKLNTIRSRKMPTWMYWQSMEQMQRYGEKANEGANIILGACDFQMVFRLNDNATAQWFSDKIGTQEVVNVSESQSKDSASTNFTVQKEAVIAPHELQSLENRQVVVSYKGHAWKGRAMAYFEENEEADKHLRESENNENRLNESIEEIDNEKSA